MRVSLNVVLQVGVALCFASFAACGGDEPDRPKLSQLRPQFAAPGDEIVLAGEGFGKDAKTLSVLFGNRRVTPRYISPTELRVTVPDIDGEPYILVDRGGVLSNTVRFQVIESGGFAWTHVEAGSAHTCAIDEEKRLWCWGKNDSLQVRGDESTLREPIPLEPLAGSWMSVEAGSYLVMGSTCALSTEQALWCWGDNGDGFYTNAAIVFDGPERILTPAPLVETRIGGAMGCGKLTDGGLDCWGEYAGGGSAEAPEGSTLLRSIEWLRFDVGYSHACGVADDQSLFCWGAGDAGQLGVGSTSSSTRPQAVAASPVTGWTQVAAGGMLRPESANGAMQQGFTCAVANDNSLWCWGANESGQLGDGTTLQRTRPVKVGGSNDWKLVTAGSFHTCALKTEGSLWCWGRNRERQAGSPSGDLITVPTLVSSASWRTVTAGAAHTCGIGDDGTLWCWGGNAYGQLANPDEETTDTPLRVKRRVRMVSEK